MTVHARPRDAAKLLGVDPASVRLLLRRNNTHWLLTDRATGARVVLRRYGPGRSDAELAYEHRVLRHLAAKGWPVAPPVAGPVTVDGDAVAWCLFPYLPGRVRPRWDDAMHAWRGELLARLHADTAELVDGGQRDGWHSLDVAAEMTPERVTLLARFHRLDRPRAVAFEHHVREAAAGLAFLRLDSGEYPTTVVHGDFLPWNIRLTGRATLAGILDFDGTRVDSRAADVAIAAWAGEMASVVDGYCRVAPLDEREEAALPLLWRAALIDYCWRILRRTPGERVDAERLDSVLERLARGWVTR